MLTLSRFARASKRARIVAVLALVAAAAPVTGGIAGADEVSGFQVSPTAFDFGDVRVGTSQQRVVTVTNRGARRRRST